MGGEERGGEGASTYQITVYPVYSVGMNHVHFGSDICSCGSHCK